MTNPPRPQNYGYARLARTQLAAYLVGAAYNLLRMANLEAEAV